MESLQKEEQQKLLDWKQKREARKRRRQEAKDADNDLLLDNDDDDASKNKKTTALDLRRQQQVRQRRNNKTARVVDDDEHAVETKERTQDKLEKPQEDDADTTTAATPEAAPEQQQQLSLLEQAAALQQTHSAEARAELARREEEARILREASQVQTNALQAAQEVAAGVTYTDPLPTTWRPPQYIIMQQQQHQGDVWNRLRQEWHIDVSGQDVPPPLKRFVDMKLPPAILEVLHAKNIRKPSPIQIQGLPVALAGRDMCGIAFTGSGKSLAFCIPLVMAALEEELRVPLVAGEGPVGLVLAPSRELARQTFDLVQDLCQGLAQDYPALRAQLLIGGESVRDQLQLVQQAGVHCVVATPGRLRDILRRRAMNLAIARFICLDEADRMLDMGFDEEVGDIMNFFPHQRQTLLFSATFPKKFQDFARKTLVKPIVVNVGRAGAANLDVIQEVEYVKEDHRITYLLHVLQKTAPPVIIFCERKGAADDIHEYLLLKGVEAVSIHGGKDQEERNEAIKLFKEGKKDVLIATDVAAKGLDFAHIQHVINFDMPSEIENYVHRIGRTGRAGKTGVATTFINKSCDETTLLDLKGLLREARQRIPPVLMMLDDPRDKNGGAGCSFCGGLGHTIVDCPKIDKDARRVAGSHKDVLAGGGDW